MIVHIEKINFDGAHYLTEMTYCPKMPTSAEGTIHFFVQHPGAEQTDSLFLSMDENYTAPARYSPATVLRVFLNDYTASCQDAAVLTRSDERWFLDGFLQQLKAVDPRVSLPEIKNLEDYYKPITISAILREMANVRHRSFTS